MALMCMGMSASAALVYWAAIRPRQLGWGATRSEQLVDLPGDDLLTEPDVVATRSISIASAPEDVWPWVAQIGQGRGGFYSYAALENAFGCEIANADRIVDAWQQLRVGDTISLHPKVAMRVALVDQPHALVLAASAPAGTPASPYSMTWAFILVRLSDGTTRLVVRERYKYLTRWASLMVEPIAVASFVMTRKMLLGIRARATMSSDVHFNRLPPDAPRPETVPVPANVIDVSEMFAIHETLRREFASLPLMVKATAVGDVSRAAIVGEHVCLLLDILDRHHLGEDDLVWPILEQRSPESHTVITTLRSQHDTIHDEVPTARAQAEKWMSDASETSRAGLHATLISLERNLLVHLSLEEMDILPVIARTFSDEEFAAVGEHARAAMPAEKLPLALGMLLHSVSPEQAERMLAAMPPEARAGFEQFGMPAYTAYRDRLLAAS